MRRRVLLAMVPLGLLAPFLFGGMRGDEGPIRASNHTRMEKDLGYHLLAPTHLPRGLQPGANGIRKGAMRVLCDYSNDETTLIVAQERRTPERDAYNRQIFGSPSTDVAGHPASLSRGSLGERRLAFSTPDTTVVLSSATLTDTELFTIARSME